MARVLVLLSGRWWMANAEGGLVERASRVAQALKLCSRIGRLYFPVFVLFHTDGDRQHSDSVCDSDI